MSGFRNQARPHFKETRMQVSKEQLLWMDENLAAGQEPVAVGVAA
ncbi:MAG: hypothetical protein Q7K57_51650 [Burkholderiaceae bacterium]|nr:hypothetical protein [Burkholderiaceae bacterium]